MSGRCEEESLLRIVPEVDAQQRNDTVNSCALHADSRAAAVHEGTRRQRCHIREDLDDDPPWEAAGDCRRTGAAGTAPQLLVVCSGCHPQHCLPAATQEGPYEFIAAAIARCFAVLPWETACKTEPQRYDPQPLSHKPPKISCGNVAPSNQRTCNERRHSLSGATGSGGTET